MFYNFDLINNFNILLSINSINSTYNILIFILLSLFSAIFLDIIYGELPTKIHPVVFIGSIISFFKNSIIFMCFMPVFEKSKLSILKTYFS